MGLFGFGKKKVEDAHKVYSFKKNGKLYYVVSDGAEEAVQIIDAIYPGFGIEKEGLTAGADDAELVHIYANYQKNVYIINN